MKITFKKYIPFSLALLLGLSLTSCFDDDNYPSDVDKVIPLITNISGETVAYENDVLSYSITPIRGGSTYVWNVTGAELQMIDGRTDKVNIKFTQFVQPAVITVYEEAYNGLESSPLELTVTVFGTPCDWILETSDTYGDGWNGGYIEVSFGGVSQQFREDDDVDTIHTIAIPDGIDFTIEYVSGGGTGAGPGWESENWFRLTSPDGTVWEEGTKDYSGIPTPGVVVSGKNTCP